MFKTELFNKISPEYPNVDENYILSYYKKITEFLIDHRLDREELEDFKKFIKINEVLQNIYYSENADIDTINKINNIIKDYNNEQGKVSDLKQVIFRSFTKDEIKEGINVINNETFFIKDNELYPVKDIMEYEKTKKELLKYIDNLGLNELETIAFIYGYIKDEYKIEDNSTKNIYNVAKNKIGDEKAIIDILYDVLTSTGFKFNIENKNAKVEFNINDKIYSLDIITDINIQNIVGTENSFEGFMPELEKEYKEKLIIYINKKLLEKKNSEKEIIKEETPKEEIKQEPEQKEMPEFISDNTMTFAIPISEIQNELAKDETPELGVMPCSDFLNSNEIKSIEDLKNFLIKNGVQNNILNNINLNELYNTFKLKETSNMSIKKYSNRMSFYIPTTENDNHSLKIITHKNGSLELINTEYSNFMESGIRYGSTSIINYKENNGEILVEEKLNRIRPVENITPDMIMPVYIVDALKNTKSIDNGEVKELSSETESLICTKENNELVASNIEETEKIYKLKELGFNEKYYTKSQIAGLNKYSDGREIYVQEENLSAADDGGITETNDMVLTKTSGKISILLITGIVGFVMGLGVGLALLILNIG